MTGFTEYVFRFEQNGEVVRIPYAKWKRIREGEEVVEAYANQTIYIAYAYLFLENKKPGYCPRIEGSIYYFDKVGRIIENRSHYFDLLQDFDEAESGVFNLHHYKKKKAAADKYQWTLKLDEIQKILDCIWK